MELLTYRGILVHFSFHQNNQLLFVRCHRFHHTMIQRSKSTPFQMLPFHIQCQYDVLVLLTAKYIYWNEQMQKLYKNEAILL